MQVLSHYCLLYSYGLLWPLLSHDLMQPAKGGCGRKVVVPVALLLTQTTNLSLSLVQSLYALSLFCSSPLFCTSTACITFVT
ncbi:hypothetical protein F5Y01DRAFT_275468 [Xylaria sp. FL0043]|nr:hypothetical protein F5Y01DRAFT_275468 [Xylaria sp. FL0043]